MELQQIKYFLAVNQYGGFTRAAHACDVSQPALTAAIKKLEAEVGAPMFYREGKRLVLTELGRRVKPYLEQVVSGTEAAREVARDFTLLKRAPLRLGVMSSIGPVRISRFLRQFYRTHPGIEVTVRDAGWAVLLRELESGEIDLAIASIPGTLDATFRSQSLYAERYVVVFAPGHRFDSLDALSLDDVSGEHYVDRLACELRESVMALCGQRRITLYAAYRSDREDWIEAMVLAGVGFAFMPQYSVRLAELRQRPLIDPVVQREVSVVDVRGRRREPAVRVFVDELAAFEWQ